MKEPFPNLWKDINLQIQEAEWNSNKTPNKIHMKKNIITKFPKAKDKEKILKAVREKQHLV